MVVDAGSFDERSLREGRPRRRPASRRHLDALPGHRARHLAPTPRPRRSTPACPRASSCAARTSTRSGLVYWMFERDRAPTVRWLEQQVQGPAGASPPPTSRRSTPAMRSARPPRSAQLPAYHVAPCRRPSPGLYRTITGHEALAFGLLDGRTQGRPETGLLLLPDHPGLGAAAPSGQAARHWASPPSRPRTRSPPSAPPSAPPTPAASASPPAPAPASRSRPRPSASPSPPSCRW